MVLSESKASKNIEPTAHSSGSIYLYNLANHNEVIQLSLQEELIRGQTKPKALNDLFQSSPTLGDIRAGEQRRTWDTRVRLFDAEFEKLVGTYSPEQESSVKIQVRRGDGVLLVDNPGRPIAELFPESSSSFRISPDQGNVTFLFGQESDQLATGFFLQKRSRLLCLPRWLTSLDQK